MSGIKHACSALMGPLGLVGVAVLLALTVVLWVVGSTTAPGASATGSSCEAHEAELTGSAAMTTRGGGGPSWTGIPVLDFFTGGGAYMPRTHCLTTAEGRVDWPWVIVLLVLTVGVIVAYLRIFVFWMRAYFDEDPADRNPKLFDLGAIFLLCATCGYGMSVLMFVWPGYRLLAVVLLALNVFSWKFCMTLEPFRRAFAADRLERELRESLESRARDLERQVAERTAEIGRLAEIAKRTANAVVITDRDGQIEWVNEGFTRITGYTAEEAVGQRPGRLLQGPGTDPASVQKMRDALRAGESVSTELLNYRKDGTPYWILVEINPLRDAAGELTGFMAIESDVTEQVEARQELTRRAAELERMRCVAEAASQTKSEFLANMSHEIRTPMTAILGYADLLSEDVDGRLSRAEREEYLTTIKRSGQHLLSVINDILDLSKIEAGRLEVERVPTDVSEVLCDVERLMRVKAREKGILLTIERDAGLPRRIWSDPVRLRQMLVNLTGNAIKFTETGEVRVRVSVEALGGAAPMLRFEVRDTGIGMTPEQLGRLFEAFTQADSSMTRRYGGTGLGLRISRSLAGLLGGDLRVSSQPGVGSIFVLRVAGVAGAELGVGGAVHAASGAAPRQARPLEGVRVLLVEDGPDNRRLISLHLRRAGAEVTMAENGLEALKLMGRGADGHPVPAGPDAPVAGPPEFDLVLTDMQMPEMDGYTLARRLREGGWTGPIVALTANAMSGDEQRCKASGCTAYITKPIDRDRLIDTCAGAAAAADGRRAAA